MLERYFVDQNINVYIFKETPFKLKAFIYNTNYYSVYGRKRKIIIKIWARFNSAWKEKGNERYISWLCSCICLYVGMLLAVDDSFFHIFISKHLKEDCRILHKRRKNPEKIMFVRRILFVHNAKYVLNTCFLMYLNTCIWW